jgi:hypothetical protein
MFPEICASMRELYLSDSRPWLVGFSGGKVGEHGESHRAQILQDDFHDNPGDVECGVCFAT